MPRLPDLNTLGARPVPQSRRGIASQDTTAVGRGLQSLGGAMGQVAEDIEKRNDEQAVFEFRRDTHEWQRRNIFDPETGAVTKRGKDAFDLPKRLTEDFDKFASGLMGKLTSNRQREIAREMTSQRRIEITSWADRHALQQREVYDEGQFRADLQVSKDRAAMYADDPAKVETELAIQGQRIVGYLRGKGRSEEEIAATVKENTSQVHRSAIAALVDRGDAQAAQDYLTRNEGAMTADDVQRVRGALRETVARAKAQTFADEMGDRPIAEARAEARRRFSGAEETAVIAELNTRDAEREALKARAYKETANAAWKVITGGGSKKQIPPAVWNALSGDEQRQINDYVEAKWRRAKSDAEGKKEADWGTYMMLTDMASEAPETFMDPQTLLKAEPYLSKAQMSQLMTLRTNMNKQDAAAQNLLKQMRTAESMVLADMKAAGLQTDPTPGSKKADELAAFRGALRDAILAKQEERKGSLSPQELQAIGMSMLREAYEQGSGIFGLFQTRKRGFQIADEDRGRYVSTRYEDIPPNIRAEIEADLYPNRRVGIYGSTQAVDKERVERIYQRARDAGRIR